MQWEVHVLDGVRHYGHPEGPLWEPKRDHRGEPIRFWDRRQAEAVCNSIAASITGRATRIIKVETPA